MKVTIRYCNSWGYKPRAARVAAKLKQELDLDTDLVVGHSGEFTVWVDGKVIAQKERGAFPEPADVVTAVRAARPDP
jgi:selenoprotein W-related protein